jgi:hypothetical protein
MLSNLMTVWPEIAASVLIFWILIALLPQRHQTGNGWLLIGFVLFFAYFVASIFLSPQLNGPSLTANSAGYNSLLVRILELVAASCIGAASWQKIKGKVTHHFLKIVSLIYLVLLILTIGLAFLIVTDQTSLQLVLLLMSGVLITILPVIHAFTYSHPHQQSSDESPKP